MKKKKLIVIIVILLVIIVLGLSMLFIIRNHSSSDVPIVDENYAGYIRWDNKDNVRIKEQEKYNISKKIKKEHKYEKYKFNDMEIYTKEEKVYLKFEVTNTGDDGNDVNKNIFISFIDKDDNIVYFMSYTLPDLKIGESKKEEMVIYVDASNAYDYIVEGF